MKFKLLLRERTWIIISVV